MTECWEWEGYITPKGYGRTVRGGRSVLAHRLMWEAEHGPVPPGHVLHHLCHNKACVRPSHLEPMTRGRHNRLHDLGGASSRARTHCPHGHPYVGDNVAINVRGARRCRACARVEGRRKRELARGRP